MEINTKYPIKVKKSDLYLLVIEIQDKNKTTHYWLPNGKYDGYCREVKAIRDKDYKPPKKRGGCDVC